MIDEALVDTDVLFKTVSYRLAHATLRHLVECGMRPRVLGAARFMLVAYVERGRRVRDVAAVAAELALIEPMLDDIEPTDEEAALAADIETRAATAGLPIDGGESQLLAMLMNRSTRLLVTGDKRAVAAIGALPLPLPPHRVACLEQLLGSLAEANGPDTVRSAVCAEPAVDKALAAACCCSSPPGTDPRPGLASYVEHLRAQAPTVLCVGSGLLA